MQFVLNACELSEYAVLELANGESAVELLIARLQKFASRIVLIVAGEAPFLRRLQRRAELQVVRYTEGEGGGGVCAALGNAISDEFFFYARADAPFLDLSCAQRMEGMHRTYAAEFTFADGYPAGFAPEIMNRELLQVIPRLIKPDDPFDISTTLFSIIERDINAFDIETELAPQDMRALRIQLHCDTRNNYLICKALAKKIGSEGTASIPAVIAAHPRLLRQAPMFVAFELLTAHPQKVLHAPQQRLAAARNIEVSEFDPQLFRRVLEQIAEISPEAMIYFSLWGEIALHSRLASIIEISADFPMRCVCETSGVGWGGEDRALLGSDADRHITWIVGLDSNVPAVYAQVRGDGFEEAQRFAADALQRCGARRVYIQAVRMRENEEQLEGFYRHWQERGANVLIQKYDHYSGVLAERKVVDISPITRLPCWHNKRDLVIHVDGAVPLCREDIARAHLLGNVHTDSLAEIWAAGQKYYELHLSEDYPALCKECDEHYTYNN